jgi:hypothetical protein
LNVILAVGSAGVSFKYDIWLLIWITIYKNIPK